jgi:hypothetical protein
VPVHGRELRKELPRGRSTREESARKRARRRGGESLGEETWRSRPFRDRKIPASRGESGEPHERRRLKHTGKVSGGARRRGGNQTPRTECAGGLDSFGIYGRPILMSAVGERNLRRGAPACAGGCGSRVVASRRGATRGEEHRPASKPGWRRRRENSRRTPPETAKVERGGSATDGTLSSRCFEPLNGSFNLRKSSRASRTRFTTLPLKPLEGRRDREPTESPRSFANYLDWSSR